MSENPTKIVSPPSIPDMTDDDPKDPLHDICTTKDANVPTPEQLNVLTPYFLKISRNKALKSIALGIIAAVASLVYTWLLLVI